MLWMVVAFLTHVSLCYAIRFSDISALPKGLLLLLLLSRFLWPSGDAYLHIIKFNSFSNYILRDHFFHIILSATPLQIFVLKQLK